MLVVEVLTPDVGQIIFHGNLGHFMAVNIFECNNFY